MGAIFDLLLEAIQLGILRVRAVTVVPRKGIPGFAHNGVKVVTEEEVLGAAEKQVKGER